jgi:hypothetical protein
MKETLEATLGQLLSYCRDNDWAGYDPYDALNSEIFKSLTFLNSRLPRLALTQALKRSPINVRSLLLIPKTQNPKAMALFLKASLIFAPTKLIGESDLCESMVDRLVSLRSADNGYWCWGYSFPWQTRTILVERGAPNLVCTTFVGSALMDVYEKRGDSRCFNMAASAAEYIVDKLFWERDAGVGFDYPQPGLRSEVHNANLLAAELLCRVYKRTGSKKFLDAALKATRYSVKAQRSNGSWWYGENPSQRWIDNFHTGYNLGALKVIGQILGTDEFDEPLSRGFHFYATNFFLEDGTPKYFHDRIYPIDIHCVAQSIITLLEFGDRQMAGKVMQWAMSNMWDERGFFYYRILRLCKVRISYMRWSQAWMLLAMAKLVKESRVEPALSQTRSAGLTV